MVSLSARFPDVAVLSVAAMTDRQAAPKERACIDCSETVWWDDTPEPLCDDCTRLRYHDARAAIREAVRMFTERTKQQYPDHVAWLALPAVVAAKEEERG